MNLPFSLVRFYKSALILVLSLLLGNGIHALANEPIQNMTERETTANRNAHLLAATYLSKQDVSFCICCPALDTCLVQCGSLEKGMNYARQDALNKAGADYDKNGGAEKFRLANAELARTTRLLQEAGRGERLRQATLAAESAAKRMKDLIREKEFFEVSSKDAEAASVKINEVVFERQKIEKAIAGVKEEILINQNEILKCVRNQKLMIGMDLNEANFAMQSYGTRLKETSDGNIKYQWMFESTNSVVAIFNCTTNARSVEISRIIDFADHRK